MEDPFLDFLSAGLIEEEDFEDADCAYCPECHLLNYPIGILGRVIHYTCRYCGIWFSVKSIVFKENEGVHSEV